MRLRAPVRMLRGNRQCALAADDLALTGQLRRKWSIKIRLTSTVEKQRVSAADRICRCKDRRSMPHGDHLERSLLDGDHRI